MSLIEIKNLIKTYQTGDSSFNALDDVSLSVEEGEFVAIMGTSGSGKSTFMNLITGRLQPDEGKIEWAKKVRVGYLDQHAVL